MWPSRGGSFRPTVTLLKVNAPEELVWSTDRGERPRPVLSRNSLDYQFDEPETKCLETNNSFQSTFSRGECGRNYFLFFSFYPKPFLERTIKNRLSNFHSIIISFTMTDRFSIIKLFLSSNGPIGFNFGENVYSDHQRVEFLFLFSRTTRRCG